MLVPLPLIIVQYGTATRRAEVDSRPSALKYRMMTLYGGVRV